MDLIELIPFVIAVLTIVAPGVLVYLTGIYTAGKRLIKAVDDAIEDDVITKVELDNIVKEALGIANIFRGIYRKIFKK
jgi:hypothetical protein